MVRAKIYACTSFRPGSYRAEYRYPSSSSPAKQDSEHDGSVVTELALQDQLLSVVNKHCPGLTVVVLCLPHGCRFKVVLSVT